MLTVPALWPVVPRCAESEFSGPPWLRRLPRPIPARLDEARRDARESACACPFHRHVPPRCTGFALTSGRRRKRYEFDIRARNGPATRLIRVDTPTSEKELSLNYGAWDQLSLRRARMAKLADALDLGSSVFGRGGSSPPPRTVRNASVRPASPHPNASVRPASPHPNASWKVVVVDLGRK